MFETNTASCAGFPGVSDAFGATLWALDYGMQMAYGNFSGALLHVGGQSDTYNVRPHYVSLVQLGFDVLTSRFRDCISPSPVSVSSYPATEQGRD